MSVILASGAPTAARPSSKEVPLARSSSAPSLVVLRADWSSAWNSFRGTLPRLEGSNVRAASAVDASFFAGVGRGEGPT